MIEPTRIEYEASDIDAHVTSDDLAILVMETDKGRIAVHMRRSVVAHLYVRIGVALGHEDALVHPPKDA